MIRIIIADDDPIILQGLSMILSARDNIKVVGEGKDGAEAVKLCREHRPDVALLDIRMPGTDGIEAAETIIEHSLSTPLLLTTFDEPTLINRALNAGAHGYILKNSPPERIISAIETVAKGGTVFAPDVIDYIRNAINIPNGSVANGGIKTTQDVFECLTPREKEVVEAVAEGLSNQEIADKLYLSNGTVRNHISTILEKTELNHRTQIAVRWYTR